MDGSTIERQRISVKVSDERPKFYTSVHPVGECAKIDYVHRLQHEGSRAPGSGGREVSRVGGGGGTQAVEGGGSRSSPGRRRRGEPARSRSQRSHSRRRRGSSRRRGSRTRSRSRGRRRDGG